MDYTDFRRKLDVDFKSILKNLPKSFNSAQFISVVRDFYHDDYSGLLKGYKGKTSAYRVLHVWISRWYLNGKASVGLIRKTKDKKIVKSVNGNNSKNTVWVKC